MVKAPSDAQPRSRAQRALRSACRAQFAVVRRGVKAHMQRLRHLAKDDSPPDDFDWAEWTRKFLAAVGLALLLASQFVAAYERRYWLALQIEMTLTDDGVLSLYRVAGTPRLQQVAATTREEIQRAVNDWLLTQGNEGALDDILDEWLGDARIDAITDTETSYLFGSARLGGMQQAGVHRFRWRHFGRDLPCFRCRRKINRVFTTHDPMPPLHPFCHCEMQPVL